MANGLLRDTMRLFVSYSPRRLRHRVYSLPFIGRCLQNTLKRLADSALYADNSRWFRFNSGPRTGLEMKLKLPEENEFYLETHDPDVTDLLQERIRPGFTVVDVGAHIGYFTLLISRLAGARGKVFALEPLPKNAGRLKEHLTRNKCIHNTEVFQLAAAEYNQKEEFLDYDIATIGRLSSVESCATDKSSYRIVVECRSLDCLIQDIGAKALDFVKIDTEGAEFLVLKGMDNLLRIYRPELLIEMHNERIIKDIIDFLEDRSYCARVNGRAYNEEAFPCAAMLGKNILFIPSERLRKTSGMGTMLINL